MELISGLNFLYFIFFDIRNIIKDFINLTIIGNLDYAFNNLGIFTDPVTANIFSYIINNINIFIDPTIINNFYKNNIYNQLINILFNLDYKTNLFINIIIDNLFQGIINRLDRFIDLSIDRFLQGIIYITQFYLNNFIY
jgi:hypothetical protein